MEGRAGTPPMAINDKLYLVEKEIELPVCLLETIHGQLFVVERLIKSCCT
jgi:hypothetical protein